MSIEKRIPRTSTEHPMQERMGRPMERSQESDKTPGEMTSFIRAHVLSNPYKYVPGAKGEVRWDAPVAEMIAGLAPSLASNEMPYPPSPHIQEALKLAIPKAGLYQPDIKALEYKLGDYVGVPGDHVMATNGGEAAIRLVYSTFKGPAVFFSPGFVKYPVEAGQAGVDQHGVTLNDDFSFPVDDFVKTMRKMDACLVLVDSPNNPTGQRLGEGDLRRILDEGRPTLVDEAYYEFAGKRRPDGTFNEKAGFDATTLIEDYPNLMVLRSMSKVHALAGLRLGALYGNPDALNAVRGQDLTFPVNTPAFFAGIAALDPESLAYMRDNVGKVVDERERMHGELNAIDGVSALASKTNFLLVETTDLGVSSKDLFKRMKQDDTYIRPQPPFPGFEGRHFSRISIGTPEMNDRALTVMQKISQQRA